MSADSPKRSSVRCVPAVVPPQVVTDRSLIDSVAGFINDVTLTSPPQGDPKDQVLWVRFENMADVSDPTCGEDWELEGNVPPPLVIVLGFGSGIKVYSLPAHGEAVEVLAWRHGVVKALRILPTPITVGDEMANEPIDQFVEQRPLMAICDSASTACSSQYCSVSFISLRNGAQVKMIKFKNPVVDILANSTSVVITFQERIAVFDARNLEDRLSITSCHPSPGMNPNPVALGGRWMAYSEWKLLPSKRSSGGCDCEGVSSYTATVLNAAKSLGKGLRELGEQVAAGLTGTAPNGGSASSSKSGSFESTTGELRQPGLVTIVDIKYPIKETSPTTGSPVTVTGTDPIIAHFIAHSDAIVALEFDPSGMLLLTADKRGHDFHVFRIQPHPAGSHLAAVHHLYVLHRGDTSAKIQDIAFSLDSRWVAVSSLRGTTHVFPITPYGGPAGVRTHGSLHVVNRLSRFHRSAGLTVDGRSSSPISHTESVCNQSCMPYNNPRTPPFPRPVVMHALAQIRQPSALGTPPGSAQNSYTRSGSGRQRLSSLSDDPGKDMRVSAVFAKARSWLLEPPNAAREAPSHRMQRKAVDSLFLMAGHGALIQYDLDVKLSSNIAKDKISDDTAIELEVEAKAQWYLGRRENSPDIQPPLPRDNWLLRDPSYTNSDNETNPKDTDDQSDRWLSQVEIITHAGPHRRLWMGPQFVFKTYNTPSGAPLSHIDTEAIEIGISSMSNRPGRSSPMNMPLSGSSKGGVPVLIESGSYSSFEQSPKLMDRFRHGHMESDFSFGHGDTRLKEDLADAMRESPSVPQKETGLTSVILSSSPQSTTILATTTAQPGISSLPNIVDIQSKSSSPTMSIRNSQQKSGHSLTLVEKVVNPLGTVTTITRSSSENDFDSSNSNEISDDYIIHENCDESLFRPVVAIFCDDKQMDSNLTIDPAHVKPPETVGSELIVPVIEKRRQSPNSICKKSVDVKTEEKTCKIIYEETKEQESSDVQIAKFNEMSLVNKRTTKAVQNSNKENEVMVIEGKKGTKIEPSTLCTNSDKSIKTNSKQDKTKTSSKSTHEPTAKADSTSRKDKTNTDDNTQAKKVDTPELKITPTNATPIEYKVKEKNEIPIVTKEVVPETVQTKEPLTKKELSFDAASSFESILIASKKVIEKAEKVLAPNKKSEKISVKNAKKDSIDEKSSKPDCKPVEVKNNVQDKDTNNPEVMTMMVKTIENPVLVSESPSPIHEIKSKTANVKIKKSKDKPLVVLQDDEKIKSMDCESIIDDGGLKFYEKFTDADIKYVELDVENFPPLQKIQLKDLEFPSLAASLSEAKLAGKKSKGLNLTPKPSPQKQKITLSEKRDASANIEVTETVTLSFSPKKKSKKNSADDKIVIDTSLASGEDSCFKMSFNDKEECNVKKQSNDLSDDVFTGPNKSEKAKKNQNISSQLSFELITTPEYTEPMLPSLEGFEALIERFGSEYGEMYYEPEVVSLINFESPDSDKKVQDDAKVVKATQSQKSNAKRKQEPTSSSHKYTKENLILALCGSLHEGEIDSDLTTTTTTTTKSTYSAEDDKHTEPVNELDERYLSLEPSSAYQENTPWTSSSEDTEEISQRVVKKHIRSRRLPDDDVELVHRDDDEELRPLIGGTNSACSMTSSTGAGGGGVNSSNTSCGNKRQASAEEDDNETIALEIAKAISDSLPDNNSHSDSSDQGIVQSEDFDFDMPPPPSPTNNDAASSASVKKSTNDNNGSDSGGNGSGGGRVGILASASSAKKKSKRKKR